MDSWSSFWHTQLWRPAHLPSTVNTDTPQTASLPWQTHICDTHASTLPENQSSGQKGTGGWLSHLHTAFIHGPSRTPPFLSLPDRPSQPLSRPLKVTLRVFPSHRSSLEYIPQSSMAVSESYTRLLKGRITCNWTMQEENNRILKITRSLIEDCFKIET